MRLIFCMSLVSVESFYFHSIVEVRVKAYFVEGEESPR